MVVWQGKAGACLDANERVPVGQASLSKFELAHIYIRQYVTFIRYQESIDLLGVKCTKCAPGNSLDGYLGASNGQKTGGAR